MAAEPARAARGSETGEPSRSGGGPRARGSRHAGRRAGALDNVVHQRVRLGIASALAPEESLAFSDLKRILGLTDGNLSVHLRKLEEAGYVSRDKRRGKRLPVTRYRLTPAGRRALDAYLSHMEAIIDAARAADDDGRRRRDVEPGRP